MARVAMLRFWSEMRLSMSMLQLVTAMGWLIATLFNVRTAANLQACIHETNQSQCNGTHLIYKA